jgi:hypothetical protein
MQVCGSKCLVTTLAASRPKSRSRKLCVFMLLQHSDGLLETYIYIYIYIHFMLLQHLDTQSQDTVGAGTHMYAFTYLILTQQSDGRFAGNTRVKGVHSATLERGHVVHCSGHAHLTLRTQVHGKLAHAAPPLPQRCSDGRQDAYPPAH